MSLNSRDLDNFITGHYGEDANKSGCTRCDRYGFMCEECGNCKEHCNCEEAA